MTGTALKDLLQYAKDNEFAIPGVNIVGTSSINACMEAAKKTGGPIMVTFSRGGGQFIAGKAADNEDDAACIAGSVAGALHVRTVAELYGVPVILHTDHCCKAWLTWFDGMLDANGERWEAGGPAHGASDQRDATHQPTRVSYPPIHRAHQRSLTSPSRPRHFQRSTSSRTASRSSRATCSTCRRSRSRR